MLKKDPGTACQVFTRVASRWVEAAAERVERWGDENRRELSGGVDGTIWDHAMSAAREVIGAPPRRLDQGGALKNVVVDHQEPRC